MSTCFHCGLPAFKEYEAKIEGELKSFCCIGCQAVAQAIADGGLSEYYNYRDVSGETGIAQKTQFDAYNLDEVQADFVTFSETSIRTARLNVVGISCAACAWLIENYLGKLPGIQKVIVNVTNRRCILQWDNDEIQLSAIMHALEDIGYHPQPAIASQQESTQKKEATGFLRRLGLAGIGMMQVGMVAVALYAGEAQGIDAHWQSYLRWVSWLIATPVMLYSANPFFYNAYRALRLKSLNMDVPIALALSIAYLASTWATIINSGEVYFDSISMLTFFLLLGRYIEMRARHSSAFATSNLSQLLPLSAELMEEGEKKLVPLKSIQPGQIVWVDAGAVFPCDGVVESGTSTADESLLTGESEAKHKAPGDKVIAGSTNGDTGLQIKVAAVSQNTLLATIENLVEIATTTKPKQQVMADKVASYFVGAVLLVATCVVVGWYFIAPEKILWVLLSVLVVTCPCALSLATPVALTAGTLKLRRMGLLVRSRYFLELLPSITHIVFDKTGTLTEGKLSVLKVVSLSEHDEKSILDIVSALEINSSHPIARAFDTVGLRHIASNVTVYSGEGVEGDIGGITYRFGKKEFASPEQLQNIEYPGDGFWQLLADKERVIGWILLHDSPRPELNKVLEELSKNRIDVTLLSGDREENVRAFGEKHNIANVVGGLLPEQKLEIIRELQSFGRQVLMVGDGINDVPVLSGANLSVAMAGSTQLAESKADSVLVNGDLRTLVKSLSFSRRVKDTIRQNLAWAIAYNLVALPAAVTGIIPPYLAAIGMSLSSLVVVVNALRLNRGKKISASGD
ncbi:heavy metal translocating P-type ATPase [Teredinibacter sp. KSP-S5-2]|uniref:heavy metal translocating P-type ATPase n=1 Tax=Teredinibacter sp. KSP-S5-2 TaxID=3034506 RepID=UPI0029351CBD|nr:heavy metal translocating P-type ATPase [Teredinibacter sp. KSP-S5-2]WNO10204.1 heavy metal translocating P-type ATPase [Teredinibacter sp. KSP-S5-2]